MGLSREEGGGGRVKLQLIGWKFGTLPEASAASVAYRKKEE
jgi:hypothetical protein